MQKLIVAHQVSSNFFLVSEYPQKSGLNFPIDKHKSRSVFFPICLSTSLPMPLVMFFLECLLQYYLLKVFPFWKVKLKIHKLIESFLNDLNIHFINSPNLTSLGYYKSQICVYQKFYLQMIYLALDMYLVVD